MKRSRDRIKVVSLTFPQRLELKRKKGYVDTPLGAPLPGVLRLLARTANRTLRPAHADFNAKQITVPPGMRRKRAAAATSRVIDQMQTRNPRTR